jgi:PKD repeat protein
MRTFGKRIISFLVIVSMIWISFMITPGSEGQDTSVSDPMEQKMDPRDIEIPDSYFIKNEGQIDNPEILYYSKSGNVYFTMTGIILNFKEMNPIYDENENFPYFDQTNKSLLSYNERGVVLKYSFVNSNPTSPQGSEECPWKSNFFYGNDPSKWKTSVSNFARVVYENVWDGIDVVYLLVDGSIKYDIILHPGSNPGDVRFKVSGQESIFTDGTILTITTRFFNISDGTLMAFTENGSIEVPCRFEIIGTNEVSLKMEKDIRETVIVDPKIEFSTLIGGSGYDEATNMNIDPNGNVIITGSTTNSTTNFPTTPGAYNVKHNLYTDIFVTKFKNDGSGLLFSTYLSGSSSEFGMGVMLDNDENVILAGYSSSSDFPVTIDAYDTSANGKNDFVIVKMNSNCSKILYSTYIGGSGMDYANSAFLYNRTDLYITGESYDDVTDFPTTSNSYCPNNNGRSDMILMCMNMSTNSIVFSTFVGGSESDNAKSIVLNKDGYVYVGGTTRDGTTDFPTTSGAFSTTHNGQNDVFVLKMDKNGKRLIYSTFIGGNSNEICWAITVNKLGEAFITGNTDNYGTVTVNYPTTTNSFDTSLNGGDDVFVTRLDSKGSSLIYSTFIGGKQGDSGSALTVDAYDNCYITGLASVSTPAFPTTQGSYDTTHNGIVDCFFSVLDPKGSRLLYSSFIGGSDGDFGGDIMLVNGSKLYLCGTTYDDTTDFPTTNGAFDKTNNGLHDVFLTKFSFDVVPPILISDDTEKVGYTGDLFSFSANFTDNVGIKDVYVEYWSNGTMHYNVSMYGNSVYNLIILVPSDYTNLSYSFYANDTSGNILHSDVKSIPIYDNDPPMLDTNQTHSVGTTGDPFNFRFEVSDNIDIRVVTVDYWFGSIKQTSFVFFRSGVFDFNVTIPIDSIEPMYYRITALDKSDNANQTILRTVNITDNDFPNFGTISAPDLALTGDTYYLVQEIGDNIDVDSAWIEYWFGEGSHSNVSMSGDGPYTYLISIPANSTDELHYIIHANDTSDNWNATLVREVTVLDNDLPYFAPYEIPASLGTGQDLHVPIRAYDNVGIYAMYFEYWFGLGYHTNLTLGGSGDAILELHISENSVDSLNYTISVVDTSGNWTSFGGNIVIEDVIDPLADAGMDRTVDEDAPTILNGSLSSDNILIHNWTWTFKVGSQNVILYGRTPDYVFAQPGSYDIILNVTDTSGNWHRDMFNVIVRDITDPIIILPPLLVDEDKVLILDGSNCSDNVGIVNWTWSFKVGEMNIVLYGVSPSYKFEDPGIYNVSLTVKDAAGLSSSGYFLINVKDVTKPEIDAGSNQTVDEGTQVTLEGSGSDNVGIVNWTWTFNAGSGPVNLYGKTISYNFTVPGNYTITLTCMDTAGNTAEDSLIISVQKKPVIKDDPEDKGSILPIIIGVVLLMLIIIGIVLFLLLKSKKGYSPAESEDVHATPEEMAERSPSDEGGIAPSKENLPVPTATDEAQVAPVETPSPQEVSTEEIVIPSTEAVSSDGMPVPER